MNKLYLIIATCLVTSISSYAQKVITNGFPGVGVVDGTTYTRTGTIGANNYSFVAANLNKGLAKSQLTDQLYILDLATNTITDSMAIATGDMELVGDTLFTVRGTHIYRINIASKAVLDSIDVSTSLNGSSRIELHPTKKELWVKADSMMHVVDYSSTLSKTSFKTGDGGDIRFSIGGSVAYITLPVPKKILKIDAMNKTIIDSSIAIPNNIVGVSVSTDSSKVFASSSNQFKIYVFKSSDLSLIDSFDSPREPFWIYRHPSRAELWCVNHFDDTVTVYKESDYSEIAAIELPSSPNNIAFAVGTVGINNITNNYIGAIIYPNPASEQLTISLPIGAEYNITILDNTGRSVQVVNTKESIISLMVSQLASGNYFIDVKDNKGNRSTMQWVKQ